MQINQYPVTASSIGENSYLDFDQDIGLGLWESQKLPPTVLASWIAGVNPNVNIATANLTQTDLARVYNQEAKDFTWKNVGHFSMLAGAPSALANFLFQGSGSTSIDNIMQISSTFGVMSEWRGDGSLRHVGTLGVNGANPISGYGIVVNGSTIALQANGGYYGIVGSGTGAGFYANSTAGNGGEFNSDSGIGSKMTASGSGFSFVAGGRAYIEDYMMGSTVSNSALFQVNSITKGFLPPRMTEAQLSAIPSPSIGLMAYQTDAVEGLYVYKSTGWILIG